MYKRGNEKEVSQTVESERLAEEKYSRQSTEDRVGTQIESNQRH